MRTPERWKKIEPFVRGKLTPRLRRDLVSLKTPTIPPEEEITSLYLWGDVGTGKTVYAAQLYMEESKRLYLNPISPEVKEECIFISVPELFERMKNSFGKQSSGEDILFPYKVCHLLVLDDIGAEKPSEWALQQLYLIINHRYEYMLKTIITSNKPLVDLAILFGDDRITSRIQRMGEIKEKVRRW